MTKINVILVLVGYSILSCNLSNQHQFLLIDNIHVIDVTDGTIYENSDILIKDDLIYEVRKEGNLSHHGKHVIDGTGKFLIPGLWDLHVHMHISYDSLSQFSKYGITGLRDLGTWHTNVDSLELFATSGEVTRRFEYYYSGYTLNGAECEVGEIHKNIADSSELKDAVNALEEMNASFIKIHDCFPWELMPYLHTLSTEKNMPIAGHIPTGLSPAEASNYLHSFEHIDKFMRAISLQKNDPAQGLGQALDRLINSDELYESLTRNKNFVAPTIAVYKNFISSFSGDQYAMGEAVLTKLGEAVKKMHASGIPIIAASDFGVEGIPAGKGIHNELRVLNSLGLSPLEALQTVITNPVHLLDIQDAYGAIEPNKKADLVMLSSNPLESTEWSESVEMVFKNGVIIFGGK